MSSQENAMLTEAIAAVRAGDNTRARDLLARLLRVDSANPEYWLWMSAVVESDRERLYCLQSVLRYDPTNRAAIRGLTILGGYDPETFELPPPLELEHRKIVPPQRVSPVAIPWKFFAAAGGVIGTLALVLLIVLQPRETAPAPTLPPPSLTFTSTPATTPTSTPIPIDVVLSRTPVPTENATTPLALNASFNPTPTPHIGLTAHPVYEAYSSALKALQRSDYSTTIQLLDQVFSLDPNLSDAYYLQGEAYRLMGRVQEAERSYLQAIERNPNHAEAYLRLGEISIQKSPNSLPPHFEQALSINPTLLSAYVNQIQYFARNQSWEEVRDAAIAARSAGALTPWIQIRLGEALLHLGSYEEALSNVLRGTADDPSILRAYLLLAQILIQLDRPEEAIRPLQTYLVYSNEDPTALSSLAYIYYLRGDVGNAEQISNFALSLNDREPLALLLRGVILLDRNQMQDALAHFELVAQLGYQSDLLDFGLSKAYYRLGEYALAIEYLQKVINGSSRVELLAESNAMMATFYAFQNPPNHQESYLRWQAILALEDAPPEIRNRAVMEIMRLIDIFARPTPTPTPSETEGGGGT